MERKKENGNGIYHENGKLKAIGNYKNGEAEGEWKYYDDNENLYSSKFFVNGVLKNIKNCPSSLSAEEIVKKKFTCFYVDHGRYINGKKYGEWKSYYATKLRAITTYINDIKHGSHIGYHNERIFDFERVSEKGYYKNGKKEGEWKEFYQKSIKASGKYKNDKKHGEWKIFFPFIYLP